MSYTRVIPRDLFNEASLLKCYGKLWHILEGNPKARFPDEPVESFDIVQSISDGRIWVENLPLVIDGAKYRLSRPLNSRELWPLYAECMDDFEVEEIQVFTDDGDLTPEMKALIAGVGND